MFSNFLNGEEINGLFFADCPFCGGQMVCNEREFVCYDCGEHGDIADFLAKKNRVSKTTARWQLNHESNEDLFYVLEKACEYYSSRLNFENAYLVKRGITEETAKVYHLGWADGNLIKFLENEGIELLTAQRAGLIKLKGNTYRDVFYKRLMFPIFNRQGKIIGFGGRIIEQSDAPKYLNSPETKIFQKKECLFGVQNLDIKKPVYLVEGYMDALTLQSYGINAVAALGTAVGSGHAHLLRSLKVKNIILSLDGDNAGVKNALKGLTALKEFNVQILCNYGECKDPDEFIRKNGKEAFELLPLLSVEKFKLKSGVNPVDIL